MSRKVDECKPLIMGIVLINVVVAVLLEKMTMVGRCRLTLSNPC